LKAIYRRYDEEEQKVFIRNDVDRYETKKINAKRRWRIGKVKKMKSKLKETKRRIEVNLKKVKKMLNYKKKRLFEDKDKPNDESLC